MEQGDKFVPGIWKYSIFSVQRIFIPKDGELLGLE